MPSFPTASRPWVISPRGPTWAPPACAASVSSPRAARICASNPSAADEGRYDAIILAAAGLKRLGFGERVASPIPPEDSLPAIGQGAIGVECREDDERVNGLVAVLHHPDTAVCVAAERALNRRLAGGCQVPIAGYAVLEGAEIRLRALVGALDGSRVIRAERRGRREEAAEIGEALAEELLRRGADRILAALLADSG